MKWLRSIVDFYIDSSIHVALSVISFLMISGIFLALPISPELVLFVFFATIACYNILKYGLQSKAYLELGRANGFLIILLSVVSLLLALYYLYSMPLNIWLLMGVLSVLILFYIWPVLPSERNLRSLGILKVILVSIIWMAVTVILPAIHVNYDLDWDISVFSIQRFLLIVALIIPFEIRDMEFDPPEIRTIPRRIGVRKTKILGMLIVLLVFLLTFFRDSYNFKEVIARLVLLPVLAAAIWKTPERKSGYYASFWVESLPIFWYGIIVLLYYYY